MTRPLTPVDEISLPKPRQEQGYTRHLVGREFRFESLKVLLGAADISKAGDRHAGLAAADEVTREAARKILSSLTLAELYETPLLDSRGSVDSVMRVNYDIDLPAFSSIAGLTLGELKDRLLRGNCDEIAAVSPALTGVMAAGLAKLCDVHELVLLASRIHRPTQARTRLGLPGTLSSRLQPNHPTDDLRGVTLLVYWGLSLGAGDALIGVNPAVDTVDSVGRLLRHLDRLRQSTGAPTQNCVLAHIKTQLACLAQGDPVEILFQSLAGTESTLLTEFDVSVELLDRGYRTMAVRGPLRETAKQWMYFETGQGSEFTYGKHEGIDMTTAEALCYGLARRYDPFMVNNVTGFIGPETHLENFEMIVANLQDHFMGKLLGLPMGMAPCYTLHSKIALEGQQIATQLLTAAGANYYMDVALNTDRMLAYFDTSGHDDQTLREIYGKEPAPEFAEWAIDRGIFKRSADGRIGRGPNWGRPEIFCTSPGELAELTAATPAAYGFETAGPRPTNAVGRETRLHQAVGREAIQSELRADLLAAIGPAYEISTRAASKEDHLDHPDAGSRISDKSRITLKRENCQVQVLISDGLSAEAVHANAAELVGVLSDALAARSLTRARTILARYGRVKLAEEVAEATGAELVVHLIGERPGGDATSARSMSAYLVYALRDRSCRTAAAQFSGNSDVRYEYTVISNIHSGGLPAVEAGAVVAEKVFRILEHQAAGNRLEAILQRS